MEPIRFEELIWWKLTAIDPCYQYWTNINNQKIYIIDAVEAIITSIRRSNLASGFIVGKDLTLNPCYIAKINNYFAHGYSIKQAIVGAQSKRVTIFFSWGENLYV